MGPPSYMWSVVDRNVVMRLMTVYTDLSPFQFIRWELKSRKLATHTLKSVLASITNCFFQS